MPSDMSIGQPIPDDPTDPVGGDLRPDLTDEQVEAALRGDGAPKDYPPDDDEQVDPESKPVQEEQEQAKPDDVAPAEPVEPQTAEDRLAALESQVRLERLERERAEAVAERERFLHSRNAGELGYLKKMLAERKSENDYSPSPDASQQPELDEIRNEISALKSERVQQGIAEEVNNFQRAYPDAVTDEPALMAIVQKKMPDYQDFLNGSDPKLARTMARSLLKESYAELRIEKEQASRSSAVTRNYDQADKLKARKIAAGSQPASRTAPISARTKSVDDLTDAEVDALADAYVNSRS